MATSDDRRAARLLLLLAAAGLLVRYWQTPGAVPGAVAYRAREARPGRDSVATRAARLARPLARSERIDVDRAPAEELARLPRVGPGLAARIVADREARGPFGSLDGLDRVPGVGPSVLGAIGPHVTFSAAGLAAAVPATPASPPSGNSRSGPPKVSLNTASEADLVQLPGIGPVLAHAIVEDRRRRGPYRSLDDLGRVRGIGTATLSRLKDRIVVP